MPTITERSQLKGNENIFWQNKLNVSYINQSGVFKYIWLLKLKMFKDKFEYFGRISILCGTGEWPGIVAFSCNNFERMNCPSGELWVKNARK